MNVTKKTLSAVAAGLFAAYLGGYAVLRFGGTIIHYQNKGRTTGDGVTARVSRWNDLLPNEAGAIERFGIRAVNLVYAPIMTIEERWHRSTRD